MSGEKDDSAESRRILKGVDDAASHGFLLRAARDARDHASAKDVDQDDPIEVLGTRIGRTVGVAVILALALWFLWQTFGGSA